MYVLIQLQNVFTGSPSGSIQTAHQRRPATAVVKQLFVSPAKESRQESSKPLQRKVPFNEVIKF